MRPHESGDDGAEPEQFRKVFIGGLSQETSEETLRQHFEEWGEIVDCVVMRDQVTRKSRGFGFVTYKYSNSVDEAQDNRPHLIDTKTVETKRATPREESNKPGAHLTLKKAFISGIKDDIEEEDLRREFSKFGSIEAVEVMTDKGSDKKRGFAFITFDDYDPVDKLVLARSVEVNGHRCDVKKAVPKEEMQSKGSGGRGGGRGGRGGSRGGGYGGGMDSGYSQSFGRAGGMGGGGGGGGGYGSGYGDNNFGSGWNTQQTGMGYDTYGQWASGYGQQQQQQQQQQQNYGGQNYGGQNYGGQNYGANSGGGPMRSGNYNTRGQGPYGVGYGRR